MGKVYKADVWDGVFVGHNKLNLMDQEDEKKKLLLERFTEEHKGFDFS